MVAANVTRRIQPTRILTSAPPCGCSIHRLEPQAAGGQRLQSPGFVPEALHCPPERPQAGAQLFGRGLSPKCPLVRADEPQP